MSCCALHSQCCHGVVYREKTADFLENIVEHLAAKEPDVPSGVSRDQSQRENTGHTFITGCGNKQLFAKLIE